MKTASGWWGWGYHEDDPQPWDIEGLKKGGGEGRVVGGSARVVMGDGDGEAKESGELRGGCLTCQFLALKPTFLDKTIKSYICITSNTRLS